MMGDLTKNISRHEVACKCTECSQDSIDFEVVQAVQDACDHWALRMGLRKVTCHILSANRCPSHNFQEGGADNSQHLYGKAIDFIINGVDHGRLYEYLDKQYKGKYGIGLYDWGVHIDSRSGDGVRW